VEFSHPVSPDLPTDGCARWDEFAGEHQLPAPVRFALDHALVEHLQNIVNHGEATQVVVQFELDPGWVRATVSDDGGEFDPTHAPAVDTSAPLEGRRIGGLGIHMIRKMTDSLSYHRLPGINRLEMSKRLGPA
jgi:serine/threonine-protein kinase RsbW